MVATFSSYGTTLTAKHVSASAISLTFMEEFPSSGNIAVVFYSCIEFSEAKTYLMKVYLQQYPSIFDVYYHIVNII